MKRRYESKGENTLTALDTFSHLDAVTPFSVWEPRKGAKLLQNFSHRIPPYPILSKVARRSREGRKEGAMCVNKHREIPNPSLQTSRAHRSRQRARISPCDQKTNPLSPLNPPQQAGHKTTKNTCQQKPSREKNGNKHAKKSHLWCASPRKRRGLWVARGIEVVWRCSARPRGFCCLSPQQSPKERAKEQHTPRVFPMS